MIYATTVSKGDDTGKMGAYVDLTCLDSMFDESLVPGVVCGFEAFSFICTPTIQHISHP